MKQLMLVNKATVYQYCNKVRGKCYYHNSMVVSCFYLLLTARAFDGTDTGPMIVTLSQSNIFKAETNNKL